MLVPPSAACIDPSALSAIGDVGARFPSVVGVGGYIFAVVPAHAGFVCVIVQAREVRTDMLDCGAPAVIVRCVIECAGHVRTSGTDCVERRETEVALPPFECIALTRRRNCGCI